MASRRMLDEPRARGSAFPTTLVFVAALLLSVGGLLLLLRPGATRHIPRAGKSPAYSYGGPAFDRFVAESYRVAGAGRKPTAFYRAMDLGLERAMGQRWGTFLASLKARIYAEREQSEAETEVARDIHGAIKQTLPRFSLDRGFEFACAEAFGERQCLLQSVIIASMLQRCGVDAGVAMVWSNEKGQTSNNGHAVTLMRRRDGALLVVDASEPRAFATHQGLFFTDASRRPAFARARYDGTRIASLERPDDGREIALESVGFLNEAFLRSQFDYYRGERVPKGLLDPAPTSGALRISQSFLERSVRECPINPLPAFVLSRVQRRLGLDDAARKSLAGAFRIYRTGGWVPESVDGDARQYLSTP